MYCSNPLETKITLNTWPASCISSENTWTLVREIRFKSVNKETLDIVLPVTQTVRITKKLKKLSNINHEASGDPSVNTTCINN